MPKLVVFRGDKVEAEFPLTGTSLRIGRDAQNDIVLDDAASGVSRFHAEVHPEGGSYTIVDKNSRNGLWVHKRRVQSAPLELGTTVNIGAYELVIEDESGSQDIGGPLTFGATVVATDRRPPPPPPAPAPPPVTEPPMDPLPTPAATAHKTPTTGRVSAATSAPAAGKQRTLWWAGTAIVILAIVGVGFAVRARRAVPPSPVVAETPPSPAAPPEAPSPPPKSETEKAIDQHLADANDQIGRGEYEAARRDHLQPALELDPQNEQARTLMATVDEAIAKAKAAAPKSAATKPKPTEPVVELVSGIPRLTNEPPKDYEDRSRRIVSNYNRGKLELDQKHFGTAIGAFRAVERDLANYADVRALMANAESQRNAAFREAMDSAAQNENAGRLPAALQGYQRAEQWDTGSSATEKAKAVRDRIVKEAEILFQRAETYESFKKIADAIRAYQQIVDSVPQGLEIRDKAQQKVKALK